jgi:hypothetical protein
LGISRSPAGCVGKRSGSIISVTARAGARSPDIVETNTGIDLVSCGTSQQRLDCFQQTQHASDFVGMLPIPIVCPPAQSFNDDISRRTQQYDLVELGKELPHILRTTASVNDTSYAVPHSNAF